MTAYAELQVTSNFSFLRGASHPDELAITAAALGLKAIAITDRNSLAGVVRAHMAAKRAGIALLVGVRLDLSDGPSLLCYPTDRAAYGRLCRLLTLGKRRTEKGRCELSLEDLFDHGEGQIVIALAPADPGNDFSALLAKLAARFGPRAYLAAAMLYRGDDARRLALLAELAAAAGTPLVATNDVHAHSRARRPLQDVLSCIRAGCTIAQAGSLLFANAERHLKAPAEMARLFAAYPEAVARTVEVAAACRFSLDELRYEYPTEVGGDGRTPQEELARLTWIGATERYGGNLPDKVRRQLNHELTLIGELNYAPYFLTVYDIVRFARERGILCQGRGSAANSAVCYCLGITAVDPARADLLFERFVSAERNEPPDIDVDFEHERREEVIQYIYQKYGRDRAGLTATVISYRGKSAVREVGKVMGLSLDMVGALSKTIWGWSRDGVGIEHIREIGLDPEDPNLRLAIALSLELIGFPRHLSQHVGGFVISRGPLCEMVPIENAAMAERTVIEWDKDDLDALGMLKVDVLALGMLTCIHKGFDLLARHYGRQVDLATVPAEEPGVYDMLCRADSVGVFQVESRAQMSMLPRLKPRDFYDLVIEVAIVRPGPIQGDMVHPYLRRRSGEESVDFPSEELRQVLGKTLGVPLFQEQAMRIAIVAAGFTPSEADQLRRAMATFRKTGTIHTFREKLVRGMVERDYDEAFAERCFNQIEGFGEYGFPESHAASFALLVYVSAWMKCYYPDVFAAAILNSQPMGFYAPAQLVRDAHDHGVEIRPLDINYSDWDYGLEARPGPADRQKAVRVGLRQVKGLAEEDAARLVAARGQGYRTVRDLWRRSGLKRAVLERLAQADAFRSVGLDRRAALWAVRGLADDVLPLFAHAEAALPAGSNRPAPEEAGEPAVTLPAMSLGEHVIEDYTSLRLSLKAHPCALLRNEFSMLRVTPAARLAKLPNNRRLTVAGLVLVRQRPGSAKGIIFVTLEDETGVANCVIWKAVFERHRRILLSARLLAVKGRLQREGEVIHIVAEDLLDFSHYLGRLTANDMTPLDLAPMDAVIARADVVKHPPSDPRTAMPKGRNFR